MADFDSFTAMSKTGLWSPSTLDLAMNKPSVYDAIVKQFGDQYRSSTLASDLFYTGADRQISSEFHTLFQEGWLWENVTVATSGGISGGSSSETLSIELPSTEVNFVKEGQILMIPSTYQSLYISDISIDSANDEADLTVVANDGATTPAIADDTVLMIGTSAFGEASDQPDSTIKQYDKIQMQLQILKDTTSISGSQMTEDTWVKGSEYGMPFDYYSVAVADADARMDLMESDALVWGDGGVVTADATMVANGLADAVGDEIRKTKGLVNWAKSDGYELPTDASVADYADLEDLDNYLRSQGDTSPIIKGRLGHKLARAYSNNLFDNVVTGNGTDVTAMMKANGMSDSDAEAMAAIVKYQQYSDTSRDYMFTVADEFSHPKRYGSDGYKLDEAGIWYPCATVKSEDGMQMPMVSLLYKGEGSHSRRRTFWTMQGAGENPGMFNMSKDVKKAYMRSHIGLGVGAPNLLIFSNPNA